MRTLTFYITVILSLLSLTIHSASANNKCRVKIQEEQKNDKLKKKLAEENGLKYIMVDASCSEIEYIKNSLLNLLKF